MNAVPWSEVIGAALTGVWTYLEESWDGLMHQSGVRLLEDKLDTIPHRHAANERSFARPQVRNIGR